MKKLIVISLLIISAKCFATDVPLGSIPTGTPSNTNSVLGVNNNGQARLFSISDLVSGSLSTSNATGTNLTTFGSTNYFRNDGSRVNNGPSVAYSFVGGNGYSNLVNEIVLGNGSAGSNRHAIYWSTSLGSLGDYGGLLMNTDHDGEPAAPGKCELQIFTGRHIALCPGINGASAGHIQVGIASGSFGYGGNNTWTYYQEAQPLAQSSPTGFSGALTFRTSELQGANGVDHYPGLISYSILTNAPGRWALGLFSDLGNNGGETWDPNSMKANERIAIFAGDTNFTRVRGLFSVTNFTAGSLTVADIPEDGSLFNVRKQLQTFANTSLGINGGNPEMSVFTGSPHAVALNSSSSANNTAFYMRDSLSSYYAMFDPGGAGFNGNWLKTNLRVGSPSTPQQTFDVIGTSGHSDTAYFTNGISTIGGRGIEIATNAIANWPTAPLTRGGCALVNSNSYVYLLQSDPNGTTWTSTNKIGK